ncbi:MAG: anthranilate phosphoribosyltransferase, partial [Propionibacteriaceae bacterium]|nr:anthranilate phosphoribosyltransferase [Propionibacteriaceae bacterium]
LLRSMLAASEKVELESNDVIDIVGTGGDRHHSINVSTLAALVVAGAGGRVCKHGNRAASSACGSADVLEALGVVLDLPPEAQQGVVDAAGIAFLFAPLYHAGLRHAAVPRRELGIPTTFNFLGPLANPAQPNAAAVGVADARMAELMAGVFAARGGQGLVFHGDDGLDELTTTTTSTIWAFADGRVSRTELDPAQLGVPRAAVDDLVGGNAATNAAVVSGVLAGETGPVRDIVVLNAAAALTAYAKPAAGADLLDQLRTQLTRAEESIDSGAAAAKLHEWVAATKAAAR